jgi:signal transduction histidine kinase
VSEDGSKLLVLANRGYPEDEKSFPVRTGVAGRVVRSGKPQVVNDVTSDSDYVPIIPETRSQLSVPILLAEQVIGVINLESSEVAGFRDDDVQLATRLAERAVVPIQNAQLYEQVIRANDAKTQFVSMVAHELKVPMTSIGGYARLLELSDGPIDDTKRGFIKTITSNVDRMNKTVSDLLDISRVERGRLKLDLEEVSMASVIDETLDTLRSDIEEKGLELRLTVPGDLPPVWGDRARLVQVLINLVTNANKYTIEGYVHVEAEVVELPLSQDGWEGAGEEPEKVGRFVRCSVHDTGIGISEEDQERLFRSQFVRFENALEVAEGHGLGLWLTNRLVEMQGGQITFESVLNQGSTFAFTVPVDGGQACSDD